MFAPRFPTTSRSLISGIRDDDERERRLAIERLVEGYWQPVYRYVRVRWGLSREDAEDLTQDFFSETALKGALASYSPEISHFRGFVRLCVDREVANWLKAAGRVKRGGDLKRVAFEIDTIETEMAGDKHHADPEKLFEREWIRGILRLALEELRRHSEETRTPLVFELYRRYYVVGPPPGGKLTVRDLAEEAGLTVADVKNKLTAARNRLRLTITALVRDLTTSQSELNHELETILGAGA